MRCLEWSDIDWAQGLIHIREKKIDETRSVPIPGSVIPRFRKRIAGKPAQDALFKNEGEIGAFGVRLDIRDVGELLDIKIGEVDLASRMIVTKRSYVWKPKGRNGVVPMCSKVRSLLTALAEKKTSNFVFAHHDGGSCRMHLLDMLKKTQKMAGIKGRLRIHDLRHTLAVRLRKDKKVPLETIMGILRHADIRETLIYAPYSLDEGRAAMSCLDEPDPSTAAS